MSETPEAHRLIKPTTMSCEIVLNLGVVPSVAAAKTLSLGMDKTLNALVQRKSGNFIKDMKNKVRAIGAVLEKNGESAKTSDFLQREEADLKALWEKWSKKLAPRLAEEALQDVVKSAKEKELKEFNTKKAKAVGRVLIVPTLSLVAAAASLLTGDAAGMSSAALKAISAMMKATDELSTALNSFKSNQDAVENDISTLAKSLKTIATRINTMDKQRKATELEIASIASHQRVFAKELAAATGMPVKDRNKAMQELRTLGNSIKNLSEGIPITADLKESWKRVAVEHKNMQTAIGVLESKTPKSLRTARDVTDSAKEVLSIVSKV